MSVTQLHPGINPNQPVRKAPQPHQLSKLLSQEENDIVVKCLQPKCQSQAMAVVEVFGTVAPNHNVWQKILCGVAVYVKDNGRKSFFIQVFDMNIHVLIFEQEIYREFQYHFSKDFFHQFEGDERMIGLNFADKEEAGLFGTAIENLLSGRLKKREEKLKHEMKMQQQMQHEKQFQDCQRKYQQQQQLQQQEEEQQMTSSKYLTIRGIKKNIKDKFGTVKEKKVRRVNIGVPTDFIHISHAGLDSIFNVDKDLQELLSNIGVDNQKMEEPKTRDFVYGFIEDIGGMDEVRKMNKKLSTRRSLDGPSSQPNPSALIGNKAPPPPPSISSMPLRKHSSSSSSLSSVENHPPPPPPPNYGSKLKVQTGGPSPPPPSGPRSQATYVAPPVSGNSRSGFRPPVPPREIQSSTYAPKPSHNALSSNLTPKPYGSLASNGRPLPPIPNQSSCRNPRQIPGGHVNPTPSASMPQQNNLPPPPPPMPSNMGGTQPPPPPPMPTSIGGAPPPPPMSSGNIGIPPPPPSTGMQRGPAPPPMPSSSAKPSGDPRSALLDQIRGGQALKPVAPQQSKAQAPKDSRNELLESIRSGVQLNHVKKEDTAGDSTSLGPTKLDGWALDLHNALMKREQFIQSSDEDDDDDDDWDDDD